MMRKVRSAALLWAEAICAAAALGACATTFATPSVSLLDVGFVQAGLLDQEGEVLLCLTNRDTRPLRLKSADLRLSVADRPLLEAVSLEPIEVAPQGSAAVPFAAHTTTRNLGPQLLATLGGGADYAIDGHVRLATLPISVPIHAAGRLQLDAVARRLRPATDAEPLAPGCSRGDRLGSAELDATPDPFRRTYR